MNNLVTMSNGEATVTSRQVAENFGKRHDHVMRDISNILSSIPKSGDTLEMFFGSSYENPQNKQTYSEYIMNRDGFTLLTMGFQGAEAFQWKLKYIAAFNEMEDKLKNSFVIPQTLSQALLMASQQAQVIEEQSRELTIAKPKTEYFDKLVDKGHLTNFRDTAKELGVGQKFFMAWLVEHGYIYRDAKDKPKPYGASMQYFAVKDYAEGRSVGTQVLITTKGKQRFAQELAS